MPVKALAEALTACPCADAISSGSVVNPAFFNPFSNASSELINLKPNAFKEVLPTTNDLPEPGPPARNTALNIAGSFTPSII